MKTQDTIERKDKTENIKCNIKYEMLNSDLQINISINYKGAIYPILFSSFEHLAEYILTSYNTRIKAPVELEIDRNFPLGVLNDKQRLILEEIVKLQNQITRVREALK